MMVLKKINNNAAICEDNDHHQLIAFGKGIGFPKTPYELKDLSKIDRTFYNISNQYLSLINDIPEEIIQFTSRLMITIQNELPYETNPNLILTLADHISFAIERVKRKIYVQMPSVYEMEIRYPLEIKIARWVLKNVNKEFQMKLPKSEVQGIAMHLINARYISSEDSVSEIEQKYEEILEKTTQIIEEKMGIQVRRDTFNFARFSSHIQFLLKRISEEKHIDSSNLQMYQSIREEYPDMAACVDMISDFFRKEWMIELTEEEELYLILHINRVCSKEAI